MVITTNLNTDIQDALNLLENFEWMTKRRTIRPTLQRRLNWNFKRADFVAGEIARIRREEKAGGK